MPGRRPVKKGSFSGHFDELVKHFVPARASPAPTRKPRKPVSKAKSPAGINQKLFEGAKR